MADDIPKIQSHDQAAVATRAISVQIRQLEDKLIEAGGEKADAEATYRVVYASKLRAHREAGATVAEAEAYARADAATSARARDRAELRVKEILEQLEDRRGERHSLHRLLDAFMAVGPGPEGPR